MITASGEITISISGQDDVTFEDVPFTFNEGARSVYVGADNTGAVIKRAGWLGINTPLFEKWSAAYLIVVTFPNGPESSNVFEVNRNFNYPVDDDGWLWYPVMPRRARLYQG